MNRIMQEVLGHRVYLELDDPSSLQTHRLGSVPLVFNGEERVLVRVFGELSPLPDREGRRQFELEIRKVVEHPDVVYALFKRQDINHISARRFNPSKSLVNSGWRAYDEI